jgi:acyl carrier protein
MEQSEQKLRQFIINDFLYGQESQNLLGDDSLIEKGIIDSTGVLHLVAFLQEEFNIEVLDEDVVPENLDTLNRLVSFIKRKASVRA